MAGAVTSAREPFYFQLGVLLSPVALSIVVLVLLATLSLDVLSSLRALIAAENIWSKAEARAVTQLRRYVKSGMEPDYADFRASITLPLSDRAARMAIDRGQAGSGAVTLALLAGGNHADDIPGMIRLYRYFAHVQAVSEAVAFWEEGDRLIAGLDTLGKEMHEGTLSGSIDLRRRRAADAQLDQLETAFLPVEQAFTAALGRASRSVVWMLSLAIMMAATACMLLVAMYFHRLLTRSERLQQDLALSEDRFRLGFQGTNCGLWDWNIVTDEVFYSRWIYDFLEYKDMKIDKLDTRFLNLVHPDDRAGTVAATTAHIVHNAPYDIEFRLRTLSGQYVWVRSRAEAVRDASGRATRMVGSIFDISAFKEIEKQAYIERELAQVTLAAILDAVIRTDAAGYVNFCNDSAEKLLGVAAGSIIGEQFRVACNLSGGKNAAPHFDLLSEVLSGSASVDRNANILLTRADAKVVSVDASVAPLFDQTGQVHGAVVVLHDVSSASAHADELLYQARHDELTGLINRREFERQLSALLGSHAVQGAHAIMYLDLDQLKIVNDGGGHAAGDQLIRHVTSLLRQRLRERDVLARIGGDEFGIILRNCDALNALKVAESLRAIVFGTGFAWEGKAYPTGMSIGLITEISQFASLSDLMKVADAACFMAKEKGRNRVHQYRADDQEQALRHRETEWVTLIGDALDHNRFCLYAQRIAPASAPDDSTLHVELLVRMVDAEGGVIPPMSFIPAAERYNLMPQIDRWVVNAAFRELASAQSHGVDLSRVLCAINLSGASVCDDAFLSFIVDQQRQHDIPFATICFEITETAAIANLPKAVEFIGELRGLGCLFSLDDFGAGMASFGYLKHLPVDFLKIDGGFVKDMADNAVDFAMVDAINRIGHVMGKKTIAEFVENDTVLCHLKSLGVDFAQGYGIGRPAPFSARTFLHTQVDAVA